jgi:hypothetical protein
VNLLFQALRAAIDEAVKARGIENYSVVWKHNAKGDFFIGITTRDPRLSREKLETSGGREKPRRD